MKRSEPSSSQLERSSLHLGAVQIGVLLFALITAAAHLYLATVPAESIRFLFFLNGLGYLALLIAYFLPQLSPARVQNVLPQLSPDRVQNVVRWIFIGYTALTVILWFFFGGPLRGEFHPVGVAVTVCDILLLVFLVIDSRRFVTYRA